MRKILLVLTLFCVASFATTATAQVILKTDTIEVDCASSDTLWVPLTVQNFNAVGSFQFTLSWDTSELDYIFTGAIDSAFIGPNVIFGFDTTNFIDNGMMTFFWTNFGGSTIPDDTEIFSVAFVRLAGSFSPVEFTNSPVSIEVTDAQGNEVPWMTMSGGILPIDTVAPMIECPADLTVQAPIPSPVNGLALVSQTDNCDIDNIGFTSTGATVLDMPNTPDASGTVFNFGDSEITYTATDVGGNTDSCSFTLTVEDSGGGDLTVIAGNSTASCGDQVAVDISVVNFDSIGSLQFSLGWLTSILQFDSVSNLNAAIALDSATNFGYAEVNNGFISFAWTTFNPDGNTLPNNELLFTLYFTVVGSNGGNSGLDFGDFPSVLEAFSANPVMEIDFITVDGALTITDSIPPIISCPNDTTVVAPTGETMVMVTGLDPTFSDNCPGGLELSWTATGSTPGSGMGVADMEYIAGSTIVTYTVEDGAGNTATCSFTVTVDAGQVLTLFLDSVSVDCQGTGQMISVNLTVQNFIDVWGLQFSIEWDETVLQFESVTNEFPGLGLTPFNFLGFSTTDDGILRFLGGNSTSGWPMIPDGSTFFTINFTVLDASGLTGLNFIPPFDAVNSNFESFPYVRIDGGFASTDTIPPVFDMCPSDTTVMAMGVDCNATFPLPTLSAMDACSGVDTITNDQADDIFDAGATVITYTATDSLGNSSTCSFTLTVEDNVAPTLTNCPDTIFVNTDTDCIAVAFWDPPIATDACGASNLMITQTHMSGDTFNIGSTQVTYTVEDQTGNTGTCTFLVIVTDNMAPEVFCPQDIVIPADDALNCAAVVNFDADSTADNCDTNLLVFGNPSSGATFDVGTTLVELTAVDDFGNTATCEFNVVVSDTLSPVLTCPADTNVFVVLDTCGAFPFWDAPIASDNCTDPDSLNPTSASVPGQFLPVGINTVSYIVADAFGNVNFCSFTVTVLDTLSPSIISCPGNNIVQLPGMDCDTSLTWTLPIAEDNCGIDSLVGTSNPGDSFGPGSTDVTYVAYDLSGNTDTCTFNITVFDQIAPVFSNCPEDTVITGAGCEVVYDWILPTATDNCDTSLTISSSHQPLDTFTTGVTNVLILVQDFSGNFDTCAFSVTVMGDMMPGFDNVPMDMEFTGCEAIVDWGAPTVVGFCNSPDTVFSSHLPLDTFPVGETVVTYTAIDEFGVQFNTSFTITVTDPEPPVVACPEAIIVNTGAVVISDPDGYVLTIDTVGDCSGVNMSLDLPMASDNCDSVSLTQSSGPIPGMEFPIGTHFLEYVATDLAGNTSTCSFEVQVLPLRLMDPVVTPNPGCPGDFVTLTVDSFPGANYTWTGPQMSYPNTHQITIVSLSAGNAGLYTVQAEVNGCTTPVDTVNLVVAMEPIAEDDLDFEVLAGEVLDSFLVTLNDDFLPNDAMIMLLDSVEGLTNFGNGLFTFDATNASAGKVSFVYQICSETCPDLCDNATVTITVNLADCSFIPNIFTPNGDGVNDYLTVPCLDSGRYPNNSLTIYNQWGDRVFFAEPYSNDMSVIWRGLRDNEPGKELPDGVYYYIFIPSPNDAPIKGFVEIFR